MQIHGLAHLHGPQPINAPHRSHGSQQTAPANDPTATDQLDISREADLVSRIREIPETRAERVAQIRAAIDAGEYETGDKLDIALDRLLEEIGS